MMLQGRVIKYYEQWWKEEGEAVLEKHTKRVVDNKESSD
jgi:hypothetical protein